MRLTLIALLLLPLSLFASQDTTLTLTSTAFETDREIRVFLPDRYQSDTSCFAVTVVLDAQYDQFWNMAKSNLDYLVDSYQVVPMIAVGIVSPNRGSDFAPPSAQLKQHLRDEVIPLLEENYRVCNFRIVVGHSWGGAFVGHTAFSEHRDLFQGYLGISPSFDAMDYVIPDLADSLFRAGGKANIAIVATAGSVGRREAEAQEGLRRMDSLLLSFPASGVRYMPRVMEGTDHWSVVIPSFNHGLLALSREVSFDQWRFEQLAKSGGVSRKAVESWCKKAEDRYGFSRVPGPGDLKFYANDFRDLGESETAMVLYQWARELAPESARIQWEICSLLEQQDAVTPQEVSLLKKLAEAQKDELSESLYNHFVKWVSDHE